MGWPRREPEPRPEPQPNVTYEEYEQRMREMEIRGELLQTLEARLRATIEDAKRANAEVNNSIAAARKAARDIRSGR